MGEATSSVLKAKSLVRVWDFLSTAIYQHSKGLMGIRFGGLRENDTTFCTNPNKNNSHFMKIEVVTSIVGYWAAQLFHLTTQNMSTSGDQMKILPVQTCKFA